MESIKTGSRRSRVTFGAALVLALLTLAGCGLFVPPTHKPAHGAQTAEPQKAGSPYTIESTSGGFTYQDAVSGYAVTFPHRPSVEPLLHNETVHPANFVSFSDQTSNEFASIGEVLNKTPNLRAQLLGWVQSVNPTGQVGASSYTLDGLEAARAEFTSEDGAAIPSYLVGQQGAVVVAGDGDNFYELVALGGTSDERQAFFDSFRRIDQ
jgi:hypothetical protein